MTCETLTSGARLAASSPPGPIPICSSSASPAYPREAPSKASSGLTACSWSAPANPASPLERRRWHSERRSCSSRTSRHHHPAPTRPHHQQRGCPLRCSRVALVLPSRVWRGRALGCLHPAIGVGRPLRDLAACPGALSHRDRALDACLSAHARIPGPDLHSIVAADLSLSSRDLVGIAPLHRLRPRLLPDHADPDSHHSRPKTCHRRGLLRYRCGH